MKYLWVLLVIFFFGCADGGNKGDEADNLPNGEVTHVAFSEKGESLVAVNEFKDSGRREKCHTRVRCFRTSDWKITADSGELSLVDFTLAASDGPVWTAQAQEFDRQGRGNPYGGVAIYKIDPETLRLKPAVVIQPHEGNLRPSAIAQSNAKPVCAVHWQELNVPKLPRAFVLDLESGKKIVELENFPIAHRGEYFTKTVLEFTPNDKQIVSCHPCRRPLQLQLQMHAADTGKLMASMPLDSPATAIKYSPNGKTLAALCLDGTVLILAPDLSKAVHAFTVNKHINGYQSPQSLAFPDNGILAVVSGRNRIEFFDTKEWNRLHSAAVEKNQVNCIASSPDGKLIAAGLGRHGTFPTKVHVFEVKTGKLVAELD